MVVYKRVISFLVCIVLFSCVNIPDEKNQHFQNSEFLYEGGPIFSKDVLLNGYYSDCENLNIPTASVVKICSDSIVSDTLINLSKLDQRFKVQLSVDWGHGYVKYLNILKKGKLLQKIHLDNEIDRVLVSEERVGLGLPTLFCLTMDFMDVNLDSYLDIRIMSDCGNPCLYSFWLYNPLEEVFHYWHESPINIIDFNCKEQMIYSSSRISAQTLLTAYKIDSKKQLKKHAEQEFKNLSNDEIIWKFIK